MIPRGENLGASQGDLNMKVDDVLEDNTNVEPGKEEKSDADKMMKMDIAANRYNVKDILEKLKSGDSDWLSSDASAKYINVEYVRRVMFPLMSIKKKKKFLTNISIHLKDEERIKDFYQLCCEEKFDKIALKFLRSTSETCRIDETTEEDRMMLAPPGEEHLKHCIGKSFTLAQNYLEALTEPSEKNNTMFALRDMYSICEEKYLSMLEAYFELESECQKKVRFGSKISNSILTNHTNMVYGTPKLYMNLLNEESITKHVEIKDAEHFLSSVIPKDITTFWSFDFCENYKCILDVVKKENQFSFLKSIFQKHFPNEDFEMNINFYELKFYNIMTREEQEEWATRWIMIEHQNDASEKWYKFVKYETALSYFKNTIVTKTEEKKLEMFLIIVETAVTPDDLQSLLCYFLNVNMNETDEVTETFLKKVIQKHGVLKLNEGCWIVVKKLFENLGVFDKSVNKNENMEFRVFALIYNIVNDKEVPAVLKDFLDTNDIHFPTLFKNKSQLNDSMMDKVYKYIFSYYLTKIKNITEPIVDSTSSDTEKSNKEKYLDSLLDLMAAFKAKDIPDTKK